MFEARGAMSTETYLVTGAMGCLGSWTLRHLVQAGKRAVSFDLSGDRRRLDLLLEPEEQRAVAFETGDLSDTAAVKRVMEQHGVTRVIHLAALQVPFCKRDPIAGARVNVVGTANVFEAARAVGLTHVAFASSVAVYGPRELYGDGIVEADATLRPDTLYGVYKQADEGMARVYANDNGIGSTCLRPYTVYGVARDQGMTSEPTKAMLAAAAGRSSAVTFGGSCQFHLASDVAKLFIEAAETPVAAAEAYNLGGEPTRLREVADLIEELRPGVRVQVGEAALPFPDGVDSGALSTALPKTRMTPLREGIAATIEHFERCLESGRLRPPPTP